MSKLCKLQKKETVFKKTQKTGGEMILSWRADGSLLLNILPWFLDNTRFKFLL